ncbi:uncharacterized protein LOC18030395 [Eutrema salsugineum]|uniref:uncharacterized protein LOC18030395 n=1 Tax=Eutrema salsugineum TaxID=72664 RepID=UPI000CECE96D|nr:uncharacterized protein LOC18030395 [Eutrema salsugineum]
MVLVDQEGDRIQATVKRFFAKSFHKDLVDGRSVFINTFKVVEYNSEYRTTRTPFQIVFYATTTVSVCLDFPQEDVMAQGKHRSRLKIYLRDESDLQLPCTLWADYAKEVADYVKRNCASVVVVIIRLECIKNYRGEMSISNAVNTTQILFDPVCLLWQNSDLSRNLFNGITVRLPQDKYILIPNEDDSGVDSKDSLNNEFLGTNIRRKLSSIHSIDTVGKYDTLATIRSVANSNSWYYIACKKCEKSFFLLLNVDDGFGGTAVFVVFDKIAQKLFKKTAEEVFEESVGDNSSGLPQSLRDLEGKEFLFKVVVTEDNVKKVKTSFSVDRFTSDDYMIQTFCSQPPLLETFVCEDKGAHIEKTLPACSKSDCDDPDVSVNVNAEASIEKIVPASSKSDCDAPDDIAKLNTDVSIEKTAPVSSKRDREDPDVIATPVKTSESRRKKNSMS